jgi:alpha-L-rhamnosidase
LSDHVRRPRLSWRLPAGTLRQEAYRIEADGWDSGRVESTESVLVPYTGPATTSGQHITWRVPQAGARPAYLLRGDFDIDKPVSRARLYATAHGIYEAFLSGRRVGDPTAGSPNCTLSTPTAR